jgi:hypothetical protein
MCTLMMEQIYCEWFDNCEWLVGEDTNTCCSECTWRICYDGCVYTDSEIEERKMEDVYCPFWDINESWVDGRCGVL